MRMILAQAEQGQDRRLGFAQVRQGRPHRGRSLLIVYCDLARHPAPPRFSGLLDSPRMPHGTGSCQAGCASQRLPYSVGELDRLTSWTPTRLSRTIAITWPAPRGRPAVISN